MQVHDGVLLGVCTQEMHWQKQIKSVLKRTALHR